MNTKQTVLDKLFQNKTELSEKVELSLLSELDGFTKVVEDARIKLDDFSNDWVIRYINLQKESNTLRDLYYDYSAYISDLQKSMDSLDANVSELGIDAMSIQAYEDAAYARGVYKTNLDSFSDIIETANNMDQL